MPHNICDINSAVINSKKLEIIPGEFFYPPDI